MIASSRRKSHSEDEDPEQKFLRTLRNRRRPSVLFHYTSAGGLLGILKDRGIWATDIRYLNDSSEYFYALKMLDGLIDARIEDDNPKFLRALLEILKLRLSQEDGTEIFVSSFTEQPDQLSQWRAYCAPHGGYAVGFLSKRLVANESGSWMVPCQYDKSEQEMLAEELLDVVVESAESQM